MADHHDLVVIGGGPAGEAAAQLATAMGYSVALVERDTLGGTVVANGGAPTKTFREAALYLSAFEKEKVYGLSLSAPAEDVSGGGGAGPCGERGAAAGIRGTPRDRGARLLYGTGRLVNGHAVLVRQPDGVETELHAERVIIATGSRPLRPGSVPFDDPDVYDSEGILQLGRPPRNV